MMTYLIFLIVFLYNFPSLPTCHLLRSFILHFPPQFGHIAFFYIVDIYLFTYFTLFLSRFFLHSSFVRCLLMSSIYIFGFFYELKFTVCVCVYLSVVYFSLSLSLFHLFNIYTVIIKFGKSKYYVTIIYNAYKINFLLCEYECYTHTHITFISSLDIPKEDYTFRWDFNIIVYFLIFFHPYLLFRSDVVSTSCIIHILFASLPIHSIVSIYRLEKRFMSLFSLRKTYFFNSTANNIMIFQSQYECILLLPLQAIWQYICHMDFRPFSMLLLSSFSTYMLFFSIAIHIYLNFNFKLCKLFDFDFYYITLCIYIVSVFVRFRSAYASILIILTSTYTCTYHHLIN